MELKGLLTQGFIRRGGLHLGLFSRSPFGRLLVCLGEIKALDFQVPSAAADETWGTRLRLRVSGRSAG
jgi:hypothetical protein